MRVHNLKDQRFGRLVTIAPSLKKWWCECDCGEYLLVSTGNLRFGGIRSCGCLHREVAGETMRANMTKHGHARGHSFTREYKTWEHMKDRCLNSNNISYKNYGGRGIIICDRWKDSFENFLADMGPKPKGLTIERINNNGNYEPDNCKWATRKRTG